MGERGRLAARAALGGLAIYGAIRVVDTEARWAAGQVPGDAVEHALLVWALLTCALAALPRLSPLVAGGAMLAAGLGVELLQVVPGVPGGFQLADLGADLAGVLLATIPLLVAHSRAANARSRPPRRRVGG